MSTSPSYLTHTLPESSLTQEGYVRFKGFPVAYVKSNLSVLLLLPFEELKRRPYYSATFNGFIELHYSVSRLCPRFTLSLIEEWGSRYFGAPGDVARNLYIKEAIKRLCGWHMGQADLAFSLGEPFSKENDYPLSNKLSKFESETLYSFRRSDFPLYIVNGLWSSRIKSSDNANDLPFREARRLVPIDSGFAPVITSNELLVKVKIDDQHRQNLLGLCIREVNRKGEIKNAWFLPKRIWRWFLYEPEQKHFLTGKEIEKLLPGSATWDLHAKTVREALDALAWSQDSSLSRAELEGICILLAEMEHITRPPSVRTSPLEELLVLDAPLSQVIAAIEERIQNKHSVFSVDPAAFALACALKAREFQGESSDGGIQYCPLPDINELKTFYKTE